MDGEIPVWASGGVLWFFFVGIPNRIPCILTNRIPCSMLLSMEDESMTNEEKTRENRLRRKLDRMGYRLVKSRRKDEDAIDYGRYMIIDVQTRGSVFGQSVGHGWAQADLDDVEAWINEPEGEEPEA